MIKGRQQGSVIIVTLWTVILLTILITVIASQIRLSAQAAYFHQEELDNWASVMSAVNQAEMELVMERMPRPAELIENLEELNRNPAYRYNGQEIDLEYPAAEGVTVRIYDHAGKINLREISRPRMRTLLEKLLGEDADLRIDQMIAAWGDWIDLNEDSGVNGAERDYYEELDPPYSPHNGKLETVEEILHIRGFAEAFEGINMEAAFTLYGENELVNLNLATVEAMRLLPGLNDELIERIIAFRQENEIRGNGDVALILPPEAMTELTPWLNSRKTTNYFTILAYRKITADTGEDSPDPEAVQEDLSTTAYSETIELRGTSDRPRVVKINPYERIPVRIVVQPEDES